jgi:hypothetical protein
MPRLTRWLVKAALVWLVTALLLGVAMQLPTAAQVPLLRAAWPTYLHLVTVGWLTQLIVGVALWLFPKHSAAQPRGSERLGWVTFAFLNLGLLLRVLGEPGRALGYDTRLPLLVSAVAQLVAVGAFVLNVWPRVRER